MNNYYAPFNFPDYEPVRKRLEEKYKDTFSPDRLGTSLIDWSPMNFPGVYEYVESKFKERKVSVRRARLFFTPANTKLEAHIDGHTKLHDGAPTNMYWALNLPIIIPTGNHIQEWYHYSGKYIQRYTEKYNESIEPGDSDLLVSAETLVLDKPYFVNVGQVHSVTNFSDNPRLILSLRFSSTNVLQFIESLK